MEKREFCELRFLTGHDTFRNIRIPAPVANLDAPKVMEAADLLIAANPFEIEVGPLVELTRADVITETRTVLVA